MPQVFETLYPDYSNCIANLPNSVMQAFGVEPAGETLGLLDGYLNGEFKNVVVILLDGMGMNILERDLAADGFFRSHLAGGYSSVFPPTTVAATASVMSGLQPCTHGRLGWDCYYPQLGQNVTVFSNKLQYTDTPAADYNVAERYTGYESVFDRFKKQGKQAYMATPFAPPYPDSFPKICRRIKRLCRRPGKKYIYAYWIDPDHTMHEKGCFSADYLLFTKEEVLRNRLFGTAREHESFRSMLGDYLAVAVGRKTLWNTTEKLDFRGVHAGLTADEMRIPLIVWSDAGAAEGPRAGPR